MPRTIWNGVISFGMVSIPVGLYPAVSEKDVSFNQLHKKCGTRIKQQKWCPHDEEVVKPEDIERGYEYTKGHYVVVTDQDLDNLPVPSKHTIEILAFVKAEEVDAVYFDSTYYLDPEATGAKPFALLMKALTKKGVSALAKIAFRNKEHLCLLRATEKSIVMETLFYPDEIREATTLTDKQLEVGDKELAMAESLVDMLYEEFEPTKYKDEYREKLMEAITAKIEGQEIKAAPEEAPRTQVIDLMSALKASVEAAKKQKSG